MKDEGLEIKISQMLEDMVKKNKNIFDTEDQNKSIESKNGV